MNHFTAFFNLAEKKTNPQNLLEFHDYLMQEPSVDMIPFLDQGLKMLTSPFKATDLPILSEIRELSFKIGQSLSYHTKNKDLFCALKKLDLKLLAIYYRCLKRPELKEKTFAEILYYCFLQIERQILSAYQNKIPLDPRLLKWLYQFYEIAEKAGIHQSRFEEEGLSSFEIEQKFKAILLLISAKAEKISAEDLSKVQTQFLAFADKCLLTKSFNTEAALCFHLKKYSPPAKIKPCLPEADWYYLDLSALIEYLENIVSARQKDPLPILAYTHQLSDSILIHFMHIWKKRRD